MNEAEIHARLIELAGLYPPSLAEAQRADADRNAFNIWLALGNRAPAELSVCDVGGGVGLFSLGCKALGVFRVVLVDDFRDSVNLELGDASLEQHRSRGVEIVCRDVIAEGLGAEGPFDVITTFDSMEHWHHSPRGLFHEVVEQLKPGGTFILGVPNCVNLRKRLTVPLGLGKWSAFEEWYEPEVFRGHVREPDVQDLKVIAQDMGLVDARVIGRNWTGHASPNRLTRWVTKLVDRPLRAVPSICGDIYLVGVKPGGQPRIGGGAIR